MRQREGRAARDASIECMEDGCDEPAVCVHEITMIGPGTRTVVAFCAEHLLEDAEHVARTFLAVNRLLPDDEMSTHELDVRARVEEWQP